MGSEDFETNSLDFSEFWAGYGVNGEVFRGIKLRVEKHNNSQKQKQFIPVDFNIKSSVNNLSDHEKRQRKRKYKICPSSRKYRCPMRIAELAIPTKRQCLDTWRHRGNTLPNFMVDRLRQHIMDQKTVVHINDAIKCFKSCKVKQSRQTKINTSRMKENKLDRAKLFCCLFGHKIAVKLLPPGRTPIQTRLRNLSRVINDDIGQLVRRRKNIKDQKIQYEISEKLAVWIAAILQDSEVKLMIDDLKDLEEREGHIWNIMDNLINVVSDSCKSESISNKEEYASTSSSFISIERNTSMNSYNKLDMTSHIDELVPENKANKIEMMDIILADIIDSVIRHDSRIETFILNHIDDIISKATSEANEIITIDEILKIPTLEDFSPINKVQDNIVTKIKPTLSYGSMEATFKDNLTNSNNMNKLEDSSIQIEKTDSQKINLDDNQNKDFIRILESTQPRDSLVEEPFVDVYDNQIQQSHELFNAMDQLEESASTQYIESNIDTNHNPENIQNEMEVPNFQESNIEESLDDGFKKVKFSDINIGNKKPSIADDNNRYNEDDTIILHKKLSSSSARNYFKQNINFSPSNTHTLCNVDEIWPQEFLPPTTKLSASVSKSVISLGFIMEADEKLTHSTNSDKLKGSKQNDEEKFVATLSKLSEAKNNKVKETILLDISNLNESIQSKVEEKHETSEGSEAGYVLNVINSPVISKHKDKEPSYLKDASTSPIKLNLKAENLSSLNIESEIIVSPKKRTKEKQIQIVDVKQIKPNYKPRRQQKLRIWCMGLDNVIRNMEKWLKWIKYTHTIVSQIKKNDIKTIKTSKERDYYIKEWLKLKKSIDSDVQLWFHLYQSLLIGMNSYKNYYSNREMIKSPQPKSCVCNTGF